MDGINRSRGWDKEIPHGVLPMEQLVLSDKWARIHCMGYFYSARIVYLAEIMGIYLSKDLTCMDFFLYKQKMFLSRRRLPLATLLYEQFIPLT